MHVVGQELGAGAGTAARVAVERGWRAQYKLMRAAGLGSVEAMRYLALDPTPSAVSAADAGSAHLCLCETATAAGLRSASRDAGAARRRLAAAALRDAVAEELLAERVHKALVAERAAATERALRMAQAVRRRKALDPLDQSEKTNFALYLRSRELTASRPARARRQELDRGATAAAAAAAADEGGVVHGDYYDYDPDYDAHDYDALYNL